MFVAKELGVPHAVGAPDSTMIPCVPQSYIDKCHVNLAQMPNFALDAQASMMSKV